MVVRDTGELRELYAASHARLVAAVAALVGDVAEAEDCVQEAFARAVPRWHRVSRYDDPEAWVRHVAMNLARSRWRRTRRRLELHAGAHREVAPALSLDHVALLEGLRRLPERQREAIVLHHVLDLPLEEVAIRQRVAVGTVKARLSRGRVALARELGVHEGLRVDD